VRKKKYKSEKKIDKSTKVFGVIENLSQKRFNNTTIILWRLNYYCVYYDVWLTKNTRLVINIILINDSIHMRAYTGVTVLFGSVQSLT